MDTDAAPPGPAIDPICGMSVDPATARHSAERNGHTHYFCSAGCRAKFEAGPAPQPAPADAPTTCPMHPQVQRAGPGSCPICGMALEPVAITAQAAPNLELLDMTRRLRVGAAFALPVLLLAMQSDILARPLIPARAADWTELALSTPVVLWAGWPFLRRGASSVATRHLNMFTLIALGVGSAYLASLVATLAPWLFPADLRAADGTVAVYFEAAAVITVLALLGQVLELRGRERTGEALRALLDLAPRTARRLREGGAEDEEITIEKIRVGDSLRVRPGNAVPVDGIVTEGEGTVDESMVTGEPIPVVKKPGAAVVGGTLNGNAAFVMRAERVGSDTLLAQIVALVSQAQRSRAPVQRVADRVAGRFVPAVLFVALCTFAAWSVWGPPPALSHAFVAAISVLIIACPCALGLATPMSISVGIAKGAGSGVLIRSAEALERLERVDTLVIDKTGTLTLGRPTVTRVLAQPGFTETGMLAAAAALERSSEHPLAAGILAAAAASGVAVPDVSDFAAFPGKGVTGHVAGRPVVFGNATLLTERGVDPTFLTAQSDAAARDGATPLHLAIDGRLAGLVIIADPIRPAAEATLADLAARGLRIIMLTGDNTLTANAVARALKIPTVHAACLPDDKQRVVAALRAEGRRVAMVGDGINDAPALAEADVGVAMGSGTEIAIRSAGITLVGGDIAAVARAFVLSRLTMRNIRQNLVFAFTYNALGIPLAAGVLYPAFGLTPGPMIAAAAMSLSSVCVIANALRLRALPLGRV